MPTWLLLLSAFSILAFALLGGVFVAFSDFIMRALDLTGGSGGPEAMQAINREVYRWIFMALFMGMVPVSLALGVGAFLQSAAPAPFIAAALIYLVGVFGITAAFNVPMNNALAAVDATSAEGLAYWSSTYVPDWTFWNSVRAAACLLAASAALYGLLRAAAA